MKNTATATLHLLLVAVLLSSSAYAEDKEKIPFPEVFRLFLESSPNSREFSVPENAKCKENVGRDFLAALPTDVGLSASALKKLSDALDAGSHDIRSLLIVRNCRLVFERYKEGIGREHNHTIYSVTKSITATLVGTLLMQGNLKSLDVKVSDVVPRPRWLRDSSWEKAKRISLKHVMQMSSGLAYEHHPTNNSIYSSADRFASALSPDLAFEPGTRFNYSDGDVSVTGAMVAAAADKDIYRAAKELLFEPLEMSNYDWAFVDRAGRYPGGWGLRLRAMDMAKVGQLYLQDGEWNGRRIFSPGFRAVAWDPSVNHSYALHWWIGNARDTKGVPFFVAIGFKGQRIYVFPSLGLVIALTSSLPNTEERAVANSIVQSIADLSDQSSIANESKDLEALLAIQKKGFGGQTRVFQEDQDRPSR